MTDAQIARKTSSRPFAALIDRTPIAFDAEMGAELRAAFSDLAPEVRDVLAGAGGCAPYLKGLIDREAEWLREALVMDPDAAIADAFAIPGIEAGQGATLGSDLRRAKRRVALFTALADLAGVWPLEKVTGALTDFAGLATDLALKAEIGREIARGKLPGMTETDLPTAAGVVALAMGKMGAGELNYSSDIDLILVFDQDRYAPEDFDDARAILIRATRRVAALLSENTAEGYVFRTDLRLRPDPSVTPVILSMEAAERYYESLGRTWERAAHIKARPCAGDIEAGWAYLDRLRPFVWRKHLDFAAIQDAHDMRLRIREHKGLGGPITLPGHDMKLGRGGIREIEFFTQTRQLIAGGRDPDLRLRSTVEGLAALAAKGWVPDDVARTLTDHYRCHRTVEHRVQMVHDAQTHRLPQSDDGFRRLACMMGISDPDTLKGDLTDALAEVHDLTEGFFAPAPSQPLATGLAEDELAIVEGWKAYPALRSSRAVEIFDRLKPDLLSRFEKAARPREALLNFDKFLSRLPAGVQLFSLFEANPSLVDLIVDIAATAPALSVYLGQNAAVLDAVIGGDFFTDWPGEERLRADLAEALTEASDYEACLDTARRWQKEWHFRIGVHHLRGLISADDAGHQYTDLAEAVITALWPVVVEEFARKHGDPPGEGAALIGMGSLGARRISAASDLDLIVIYDAPGDAESTGKRPLGARAYYARLTQALVTALTAPMPEGRLYEVDMRLRPSGRQGPVATSLTSFGDYQRNEAWTWEHLALTRARAVAGDDAIGEAVEAIREEILSRTRDASATIKDVIDMRARIAEAKGDQSPLEPKIGPGRIQDIELTAQCAAVLSPVTPRATADQIGAGVDIGWITPDEAQALIAAYGLLRRLQTASKLITDGPLDLDAIGEGARSFLLRETGTEDTEGLIARATTCAARAADAIDAILARTPGDLA
ncbi:glutamine-synthetase adenylyltransferase [Maritimibacter sp. DP1N21-5]|uniref:[protein-PII] uridylyltransferase family protein n=1 Tax=Maritimibacter sp. DP1N21-5 TaxID=2836867 RepID=UPI001C44E77C|nr:glutamine-synthetase adenylyltransferase [Maritimibacter sp. DP1N21-5]MBV7409908.1 glutamine-synthetase adenylyltransferase [Maritimibacter sp. DP1N21-5]